MEFLNYGISMIRLIFIALNVVSKAFFTAPMIRHRK